MLWRTHFKCRPPHYLLCFIYQFRQPIFIQILCDALFNNIFRPLKGPTHEYTFAKVTCMYSTYYCAKVSYVHLQMGHFDFWIQNRICHLTKSLPTRIPNGWRYSCQQNKVVTCYFFLSFRFCDETRLSSIVYFFLFLFNFTCAASSSFTSMCRYVKLKISFDTLKINNLFNCTALIET